MCDSYLGNDWFEYEIEFLGQSYRHSKAAIFPKKHEIESISVEIESNAAHFWNKNRFFEYLNLQLAILTVRRNIGPLIWIIKIFI